MVRFTLRDATTKETIKVDMLEYDRFDELGMIVSEYWGWNDVQFICGYRILDESQTLGNAVREGDVVEVVPNFGRHSAGGQSYQSSDVYGGAWLEDSEPMQTS